VKFGTQAGTFKKNVFESAGGAAFFYSDVVFIFNPLHSSKFDFCHCFVFNINNNVTLQPEIYLFLVCDGKGTVTKKQKAPI
jgi:hypothetical protein